MYTCMYVGINVSVEKYFRFNLSQLKSNGTGYNFDVMEIQCSTH